MSSEEQIESDLKTAMKAGERERTSVLRMLRAALKNARIEKRADLTEDDVLGIVSRQVKQRRDSAEQFRAAGAVDRAEAEEREAEILLAYLPEPLPEAELDSAIDAIIAETGASTGRDLGTVMGLVMARYRGRVDGNLVKKKVADRLA